jgi:hypothetical protein
VRKVSESAQRRDGNMAVAEQLGKIDKLLIAAKLSGEEPYKYARLSSGYVIRVTGHYHGYHMSDDHWMTLTQMYKWAIDRNDYRMLLTADEIRRI